MKIGICVMGVLSGLLLGCGGDEFNDRLVTPATGGGGGSAGSGGSGGTGGTGGDAGSAGDAGDEDVSTGGTGGTAGEAGHDAGDAEAGDSGGEDGGDAEAEPYCDPASTPDEDPCVIHDDHGVFVSPNGSDAAGCGTMASPCETVARGLTEAKSAGKRLYACGDGGTYEESLTVGASLDALTLFGGFRCSDWSYAPGVVRTQVKPAGAQTALVVDGVTALEMRDFAFESGNATTAGASSIAGNVRGASGVVFVNSTFKAGDGAPGTDGTDGTPGEQVPVVAAAQAGVPSTCGSTTPNGGAHGRPGPGKPGACRAHRVARQGEPCEARPRQAFQLLPCGFSPRQEEARQFPSGAHLLPRAAHFDILHRESPRQIGAAKARRVPGPPGAEREAVGSRCAALPTPLPQAIPRRLITLALRAPHPSRRVPTFRELSSLGNPVRQGEPCEARPRRAFQLLPCGSEPAARRGTKVRFTEIRQAGSHRLAESAGRLFSFGQPLVACVPFVPSRSQA